MKTQKYMVIAVIAGFFFFVLYTFFAGLPLNKQLQFEPQWIRDISLQHDFVDPVASETSFNETNLIPYKLGQSIGYFTGEGQIASLVPYDFDAAISRYYYSPYAPDAASTDFYDNNGKKSGTIQASGFPYFDENHIFVFHPGGTSFSECDAEGNVLWTNANYTPITSFASSEGGVAIGTADGTVKVLSHSGEVLADIVPGGSIHPIVLGSAISEDGSFVACLTGYPEQYISLIKVENGINRVIFNELLPSRIREQLFLKFSKSSNILYFEHAQGLSTLDLSTHRTTELPTVGKILSIYEIKNAHLAAVFSKKNSTYTVSILKNYTTYLGSFSFDAVNAFIRTTDDALFVGKDTTIAKLAINIK
ncbi:MAG: hypothetical protein Ta2A_07210 [Treponemataceae bacterium]|nr:MAG: hypothetical protein Ta2A_07210 [Treponemataceae bacterium]